MKTHLRSSRLQNDMFKLFGPISFIKKKPSHSYKILIPLNITFTRLDLIVVIINHRPSVTLQSPVYRLYTSFSFEPHSDLLVGFSLAIS